MLLRRLLGWKLVPSWSALGEIERNVLTYLLSTADTSTFRELVRKNGELTAPKNVPIVPISTRDFEAVWIGTDTYRDPETAVLLYIHGKARPGPDRRAHSHWPCDSAGPPPTHGPVANQARPQPLRPRPAPNPWPCFGPGPPCCHPGPPPALRPCCAPPP